MMRRYGFLFLSLLFAASAWAAVSTRLNIEEVDGSPSTFPWKLKVTNGSLTDNGDGTATLSASGGGGSGPTGQINNANQYSGAYYSVTGSSNVVSGLAPGTSGYIFATGGSSAAPYWTAPVAGSNTQFQFNNNGAPGATIGLTWDGSSVALANGGGGFMETNTSNSGDDYRATITNGTPSTGQYLFHGVTNGTDVFLVDPFGLVTASTITASSETLTGTMQALSYKQSAANNTSVLFWNGSAPATIANTSSFVWNGTTMTATRVAASTVTATVQLRVPGILGASVDFGLTASTAVFTTSATVNGQLTASTLILNNPLAVLQGGTGVTTPSLVAGTNITSITGTWPNQTINAATQSGGGGGSSALAVGTGTASSFSWIASSPTSGTNFDGTTFNASLQGSATAFISLNGSSVTLRGQAWSNSVDAATATFTSNFASVGTSTAAIAVDTGTLAARLVSVGVSTAAIAADTGTLTTRIIAVGVSTAAIAADTGTLTTRIIAVGVSTAAIAASTGAINTDLQGWKAIDRSSFSLVATDTTTIGNKFPVDLSGANATGTLAAGRFPALTGDITTSAGALATTAAATQANIVTLTHAITLSSSGTINGAGGLDIAFGIDVSTAYIDGSTAGVDLVQVTTNSTTTFALKISSVGYAAFQPTATSTQAFVFRGVDGSTMASIDNTPSATNDSAFAVIASTSASYEMATSTSSGGPYHIDVSTTGHLNSQGTSPTLSSCGTSPSITGTDTAMTITVGSVAATACTATFSKPFVNTPSCVVTNQSMSITNAMTYTVSTTAITVSQTGLTSDLLNILCVGRD